MSQKIKVQDGIITYGTSDPALDIRFNVAGQMNVSSEVNVGNDNTVPGKITTPDTNNTDLIITTGTAGNLSIAQNATGTLSLNNAQWPSAAPAPGMFLGASSLNTLDYLPFIVGYNSNDNLTPSQLTALFPLAQSGQVVIGTSVVYYCVGTNQWRTLGATSGGSGGATPTLIVSLQATNSTTMNRVTATLWSSITKQYSSEAQWNSYGSSLTLNTPGMWRITVKASALPVTLSGTWPNTASAYGTSVNEALVGSQISQYFRGNANDPPDNDWASLSSDSQVASWTDEFIVDCTSAPFGVQIGMFAETYNGSSFLIDFSGVVTAQRIT